MKQLKETPTPAAPAPRFRYWTTPPVDVSLPGSELEALIPAAARLAPFAENVTLPAAEIFSSPVPKLSLGRLAELFPANVAPVPGHAIFPAARLAVAYALLEKSEEIVVELPPVPDLVADEVAPEPAVSEALPAIPPPPPAAGPVAEATVPPPILPPEAVAIPLVPGAEPLLREPVASTDAPIPSALASDSPTTPSLQEVPADIPPPPPASGAPARAKLPQASSVAGVAPARRSFLSGLPLFRRKAPPSIPPPPPAAQPAVVEPQPPAEESVPVAESPSLEAPHVAADLAPMPEPVVAPPVESTETANDVPADLVEPVIHVSEPVPAPPPAPDRVEEFPAVMPEFEPVPVASTSSGPSELADDHAMQSLFLTEERLTVPRVIELCSELPGINSCVLARGSLVIASHNAPSNVDLLSLSANAAAMLATMRESTARMGVGTVPAVTLHTEKGVISFFHREDLTMLVFHRDRGFVPGVREKMAAVLGELSRARITLPAGEPPKSGA